MDPAALHAAVHAFDPDVPIESAWMPPSAWYVEPEVYELERRGVFACTWQPVARLESLSQPGSYTSGCLAGEPWVVVRGEDGELRAFHNVCRHKGREVVQGSGRADELVCGYHAWRYGLDGALRSAPRMAGVRDFERGEMSLAPLRVEAWGRWAFVNADLDAAPLSTSLAALHAPLEAGGWEALKFARTASWELDCNWKVYVDNYLDGGYHIPHMHPTLDAQIDMETYRTETYDAFSIQSCGSSGERDERIDYDASERIGSGTIYAWIYPNFMLNRYGPCLDSNLVVPLGPNRCRVEYEFYFLETEGPAAQRFIDESVAQSDVTQREDVAICESVQVGLGSSAYDRGRYAPRVEIGEHHFHGLLARDLRRALAFRSR